MKAGTATKKILNLISSSIMIRLGKVRGSYMIDLACCNNKLVDRAKTILGILYGIDQTEAMSRLREAGMQLNKAIDILDSSR
jgi:N-acetylmuramic acid 6-phosphate (MurNAc-6-P) etherase